MAEVAVHFSHAILPADYCILTIFIPDDTSLQKLTTRDRPSGWNVFPPPQTTRFIGDRFIAANKYRLFQIPFAVTRGDFNLLINPRHPRCRAYKDHLH
jgi:RES domain-containing protein